MANPTTRLIGRGAILVAVLLLVATAYNIRSNSPGFTFAWSNVVLKIDSTAFYDGAPYPASSWSLKNLVPTADHFFNFSDIKPGDFGSTTISIHVDNGAVFTCLDFTNLKSLDNGVNEPEGLVDPNGVTSGELASSTYFFAWLDNGDGIYNPPGEKVLFNVQKASIAINNKTYIIGDSTMGGALQSGQTKYVGVAWCVGTMTVNPVTGAMTCNGITPGNEVQTDSFSMDVGIRMGSATETPKFICSTGAPTPPPPPPPKKCDKDGKDENGKKCNKDDNGGGDDKNKNGDKNNKGGDEGKGENGGTGGNNNGGKDDKGGKNGNSFNLHNFNTGPVH